MKLWLVIVLLLPNGDYTEQREGPFLSERGCWRMAVRSASDRISFAYCDDGCGIERDYYLVQHALRSVP